MVWFQCEGCGDTLKKPKLAGHMRGCHSGVFTCIDCSVTFDRGSVQAHTSCVTEHEKYALLATKPGGAGAQTAFAGGTGGGGGGSAGGPTPGAQFLATRAPWLCSCCGVTCTSAETLAGHAGGKKHRSKARAAEGGALATQQPGVDVAPAAAKRAAEAPAEAPPAAKAPRAGDDAAAAAPAVKWRKLATEALRAAPGQRLKASKLHRAAVAAARAKHGAALDAAGDDDDLEAACAAVLAASSRFVTGDDGRVTLAAGDED